MPGRTDTRSLLSVAALLLLMAVWATVGISFLRTPTPALRNSVAIPGQDPLADAQTSTAASPTRFRIVKPSHDQWALKVSDSSGSAINAAEVSIVDKPRITYDRIRMELVGESGADGSLLIPGTAGRDARLLLVRKPGFTAALVQLGTPGLYEVVLSPLEKRVVRVVTPTGEPIPNAVVVVFSGSCDFGTLSGRSEPSTLVSGLWAGDSYCNCAETDESGIAPFYVHSDLEYSINACKDGFFLYRSDGFADGLAIVRLAPLLVAAVDVGYGRERVLVKRVVRIRMSAGWKKSRHAYGALSSLSYRHYLEGQFPRLSFFSTRAVCSRPGEPTPWIDVELLVNGVGRVECSLPLEAAPFRGSAHPAQIPEQPLGAIELALAGAGDPSAWNEPDLLMLAPESDDGERAGGFDVRLNTRYSIPPGRYGLYVGNNARRVDAVQVAAGDERTVRIPVERLGAVLELAVTDDRGEPPWGVRAVIRQQQSTVMVLPIRDARRFLTSVPGGTYEIDFYVGQRLVETRMTHAAPGEVVGVRADWSFSGRK